ncbi:hypothetical protein CDAR_539151 [Caerostris darwini]|uniref:Uncharacterized protein n=1 Tax=Caerostris darwini TaxID=1538125 RepID=A0AAV4T2Q2_9ARAC|nr:hypothetical protein CDAR_539151 [Caerostris darwini]
MDVSENRTLRLVVDESVYRLYHSVVHTRTLLAIRDVSEKKHHHLNKSQTYQAQQQDQPEPLIGRKRCSPTRTGKRNRFLREELFCPRKALVQRNGCFSTNKALSQAVIL